MQRKDDTTISLSEDVFGNTDGATKRIICSRCVTFIRGGTMKEHKISDYTDGFIDAVIALRVSMIRGINRREYTEAIAGVDQLLIDFGRYEEVASAARQTAGLTVFHFKIMENIAKGNKASKSSRLQKLRDLNLVESHNGVDLLTQAGLRLLQSVREKEKDTKR
jgi:hypothetical protein